ncbi:MAG: hypothetical protein FD123_609 [Bacteroidetes bacterium]|nr:MAG: hypothetical protein FD123_609 [Bacteroidota bacterium]
MVLDERMLFEQDTSYKIPLTGALNGCGYLHRLFSTAGYLFHVRGINGQTNSHETKITPAFSCGYFFAESAD